MMKLHRISNKIIALTTYYNLCFNQPLTYQMSLYQNPLLLPSEQILHPVTVSACFTVSNSFLFEVT